LSPFSSHFHQASLTLGLSVYDTALRFTSKGPVSGKLDFPKIAPLRAQSGVSPTGEEPSENGANGGTTVA
jgi:hypothetical protein